MRVMCLVYFDETSFAGMSLADMEKLTDATIEEDHELRRRGQLILAAPLQEPKTAVHVRVRKGRVKRTDGPFAEAKEWVGGFFVIEVKDMDEAVKIASESEIAKMGRIEVRPIIEQTHSVTGAERPPALPV